MSLRPCVGLWTPSIPVTEPDMRFCVVGAGSIGGFVATLMAEAGHDVSVVARGPHLAAIQDRGLRLDFNDRRITASVAASEFAGDFGPQDVVVVSVKAPSLPDTLPTVKPLLGPETSILVAMNGVPWWMFDGFGPHEGLRLRSVDGSGALERFGCRDRLLGCVLHIACDVPEPGLIRHNNQNRMIVGEPNGTITARAERLVDAMKAAGIGAEITSRVQQEVWIKLLGNLPFAPISMITGATNDVLAKDPALRKVMKAMFEEASEVGQYFGLEPGMTSEERIDLGGALSGFKASTRQDYEKGRPVELDVIVNAVLEMGDIAGIGTPTIDMVYALAAQKASVAGLYTYDGAPELEWNTA